jgi:hypothetical protein
MNERLPVKPESPALATFGEETFIVGKVEVNAIEYRQSESACRQQAMPKRCQQG